MEYRGPIPSIGDNRYTDMHHKPALDILRVEYYKRYGRDLNISKIGVNIETLAIFDINIKEFSYKYLLRGPIPSLIMLDIASKIPQINTFLNWKLESQSLDNPDFATYLDYMRTFLMTTIGQDFNFIYNYSNFKDYYLAYIPSGLSKSPSFELADFLYDLMDNCVVNVIWKSEDLLADSKEKDKVQTQIEFHQDWIKINKGIDCEKHNVELRRKLTLF